jgi:hypothetical protein
LKLSTRQTTVRLDGRKRAAADLGGHDTRIDGFV